MNNQGSINNDAANDFNNCYDWNMLWQNYPQINYFYNQNYQTRTSPLIANLGNVHILNGISQYNTDVNATATNPANSCYGTWIMFPYFSIKDDNGGNDVIELFPNPFKDYLKISIKTSIFKKPLLIVYDIFGKEILREVIMGKDFEINTDKWNDGIYLIKLFDDSKILGNFKLLKL